MEGRWERRGQAGGLGDCRVRDGLGGGGGGGEAADSVSFWDPEKHCTKCFIVGHAWGREDEEGGGRAGQPFRSDPEVRRVEGSMRGRCSLRKVWHGRWRILEPGLAMGEALSPKTGPAFAPRRARSLAGSMNPGAQQLGPWTSYPPTLAWQDWPGPVPSPHLQDSRGKGQGEGRH